MGQNLSQEQSSSDLRLNSNYDNVNGEVDQEELATSTFLNDVKPSPDAGRGTLLDLLKALSSTNPGAIGSDSKPLLTTAEQMLVETQKHAVRSSDRGLAADDIPLATPKKGFLSSQQQPSDYEHLVELRNTMMRRCQWLELRAAAQGITTDPSVYIEIENIQAKVQKLDRKIALLEDELVLTKEQQKAVIELLATMGCTEARRIVLIKATRGSIVLEMEMPLAG